MLLRQTWTITFINDATTMPAANAADAVAYLQLLDIPKNRSNRDTKHCRQIFHCLLACQTQMMQNLPSAFFCIHM